MNSSILKRILQCRTILALDMTTSIYEEKLKRACKIMNWISFVGSRLEIAPIIRTFIGKAIRIILGKRSLFADRRVNLNFPRPRAEYSCRLGVDFTNNFRKMTYSMSVDVLQFDYFPSLYIIIQPSSLKGVSGIRQHTNVQREKAFNRVVDLLMNFGIDYEQENGFYHLKPKAFADRLFCLEKSDYILSNAVRMTFHREIHERILKHCSSSSIMQTSGNNVSLGESKVIKKISRHFANVDLDDFVQYSSKKPKLIDDGANNMKGTDDAHRVQMSKVNFTFKKGFCNGVKYKTFVRDWI
ncbi:hypothetical protein ACOME3_005634 [Neoechinorhynchus agilis]